MRWVSIGGWEIRIFYWINEEAKETKRYRCAVLCHKQVMYRKKREGCFNNTDEVARDLPTFFHKQRTLPTQFLPRMSIILTIFPYI